MSVAIREKAKEWLNNELGTEVSNLAKCEEIFREWSEKKVELEKSLALVSNEVPTKISDAASNIEEACTSITKILEEINEMLTKIRLQTTSSEELYWSLKDYFDKINELDQFLSYLRVLKSVQEASNNLQTYLSTQETDKAIFEYKLLCKISLSLLCSRCLHLTAFLIETTKHWHGILKNIVSSEFSNSMKAVAWPLVGSNIMATPSTDALNKFQCGVKHLLKVQLPTELEEKPGVSSSLQVFFPPVTLPVIQLLQPLRKRFYYHFSGSRQTNRIDKPEWYFTQILTWIRDHESFLETWVQPIYNDLGLNKNVLTEVISGLVELSVEKLQADLEEIQYDDALFSHTVDEVLGYERDLRHVHDYPAFLPGPLHVLTQARLFIKWITMERKFALEKMDTMLSSETAWSTLSDLDENKVTEIAHTFMVLLSTMTDRYSLLPQPGHRLQFVKLELELIDDFRQSICQILYSEHNDVISSKVPAVLNTIFHVKCALEQYDASPMILLLQHYQSQYNIEKEEADTGLFSESVNQFDQLQNELLKDLSAAVLMEVKARSRPYRKYRWFSVNEDELDASTVTQEACPMFQALANNLHKLYEKLTDKLFSSLWKLVATQLSNFLFEELILNTYFSATGGRILEKDIIKFLLPLFQQYTASPISYFLILKEACSLLSLPNIPTNVRRAVVTENYEDVTLELSCKIKHLTIEQVVSVLGHRVDVAPSLID